MSVSKLTKTTIPKKLGVRTVDISLQKNKVISSKRDISFYEEMISKYIFRDEERSNVSSYTGCVFNKRIIDDDGNQLPNILNGYRRFGRAYSHFSKYSNKIHTIHNITFAGCVFQLPEGDARLSIDTLTFKNVKFQKCIFVNVDFVNNISAENSLLFESCIFNGCGFDNSFKTILKDSTNNNLTNIILRNETVSSEHRREARIDNRGDHTNLSFNSLILLRSDHNYISPHTLQHDAIQNINLYLRGKIEESQYLINFVSSTNEVVELIPIEEGFLYFKLDGESINTFGFLDKTYYDRNIITTKLHTKYMARALYNPYYGLRKYNNILHNRRRDPGICSVGFFGHHKIFSKYKDIIVSYLGTHNHALIKTSNEYFLDIINLTKINKI